MAKLIDVIEKAGEKLLYVNNVTDYDAAIFREMGYEYCNDQDIEINGELMECWKAKKQTRK